jgi:hypothetical protein
MAMRNYGAMLDEKLLRCIDQLRGEYGEAYDRVMRQREWPANSVAENLRVATGIAEARGLMTGTSRARRPEPEPEPEKVNTICRGCGGTGVDHSVPTRMLQVAQGPWNIGPKPGAKRLTTKVVQLGLGVQFGQPLALLLATIAKAHAEGREVRHDIGVIPFPLAKEHACTWCHGTGEPQLSTQALQGHIDAT